MCKRKRVYHDSLNFSKVQPLNFWPSSLEHVFSHYISYGFKVRLRTYEKCQLQEQHYFGDTVLLFSKGFVNNNLPVMLQLSLFQWAYMRLHPQLLMYFWTSCSSHLITSNPFDRLDYMMIILSSRWSFTLSSMCCCGTILYIKVNSEQPNELNENSHPQPEESVTQTLPHGIPHSIFT